MKKFFSVLIILISFCGGNFEEISINDLTTTTTMPTTTSTTTTTTTMPTTTTTTTMPTTTTTTTTTMPTTTTTMPTTTTTTTTTTTMPTTTTTMPTTTTTMPTTLAQPFSFNINLLCYKDGEGSESGWSGNYGVGISINVVAGPAYVDFYISAYGANFAQSRRTVNISDSVGIIFSPDAKPIVYYRVSNDENELNNMSFNSFPALDLSLGC